MLQAVTLPAEAPVEEAATKEATDPGWGVIVWNDPVNTMSYVVYVFMKVLAFDEPKATRHMLEVHHQGKSMVIRDGREKCELYCQQLLYRGLKATVEKLS